MLHGDNMATLMIAKAGLLTLNSAYGAFVIHSAISGLYSHNDIRTHCHNANILFKQGENAYEVLPLRLWVLFSLLRFLNEKNTI